MRVILTVNCVMPGSPRKCVRDIYTHADHETAADWITRLGADLNAE